MTKLNIYNILYKCLLFYIGKGKNILYLVKYIFTTRYYLNFYCYKYSVKTFKYFKLNNYEIKMKDYLLFIKIFYCFYYILYLYNITVSILHLLSYNLKLNIDKIISSPVGIFPGIWLHFLLLMEINFVRF